MLTPFLLVLGMGCLTGLCILLRLRSKLLVVVWEGVGVDGPSAGKTEPPITPVVIVQEAWS